MMERIPLVGSYYPVTIAGFPSSLWPADAQRRDFGGLEEGGAGSSRVWGISHPAGTGSSAGR